MWLPNRDGIKRIGLLDYQDSVRGSSSYDVVSLLQDARQKEAKVSVVFVL
jgi:aminoglycoside/choline kinase family phosphotransferase